MATRCLSLYENFAETSILKPDRIHILHSDRPLVRLLDPFFGPVALNPPNFAVSRVDNTALSIIQGHNLANIKWCGTSSFSLILVLHHVSRPL